MPITGLDQWLKQQFQSNTPMDSVARSLVTAGGAENKTGGKSAETDPKNSASLVSPLPYLVSTGGQAPEMASSVSRVFLGVKLECAMCHDHPFADWTQEDFWGLAAFFSGAPRYDRFANLNPDSPQSQPSLDVRKLDIVDTSGTRYTVSLPWLDEDVGIPKDELPRQYFADWLTAKQNPHFAATMVNRVWQQLCGVGLTFSVDDLDQATRAERDVILDSLAGKFVESDFDLRALVRAICATKFYQRPSDHFGDAEVEPRPLKVLTPDQLFDSLEVALALPTSKIDNGPRFNGLRDALLARMEEAVGSRPDDFRSGIPQTLALMNGMITDEATNLKSGRTLNAVADAPFLDINEKVSVLFLATIGREPNSSERDRFVSQIENKDTATERKEVLSELLWALVNSPEFVLIR